MSELIVWHDGACPLCRREIALMRRLDRRGAIRFVDVTTTSDVACPIDRADLLALFHASEDGTLLRPLGLASRAPIMLRLLEHLYRAFLRVRPHLQRLAREGRPA